MTYVYVDSRYRQSYEGFSSFQCSLTMLPKQAVKCRLVSTMIPLSGYTFRQGISNLFKVTETGGATLNIIIPAGNYNSLTFGPTLQSLFTAPLTGSYSVNFSQVTGTLTITSTVAFQITWTNPELAYVFGFPSSTTAMASSQTGTFSYNLSPPNYLLLRIEGTTPVLCTSNQNVSATFVVPTTANTSFFTPTGSSVDYVNLENSFPSTFKVTLSRPNGELYDATADWGLVLHVE